MTQHSSHDISHYNTEGASGRERNHHGEIVRVLLEVPLAQGAPRISTEAPTASRAPLTRPEGPGAQRWSEKLGAPQARGTFRNPRSVRRSQARPLPASMLSGCLSH
eukprot:30227-Pyramimonas_sp.AAC.1